MNRSWNLLVLVAVIGFSLPGCGPSVATKKPAETSKPAESSKPKMVSLSEKAIAALAAADKVDGKEDHVIERCYVCGLGMDGKAEHTVEANGYSVHLCSKDCCEHFAENAEKVVLTTEIPKPDKQ